MLQVYLPIFLLLVAVLVFVFGTIGVTHLAGPKSKTAHKQESFECGVVSQGDARQPFSVKYFLVAILFVVFDVEIIFLYPWAVNFKALGWVGLFEMMVFISTVLVGFFYLFRHDVFNFKKSELKP